MCRRLTGNLQSVSYTHLYGYIAACVAHAAVGNEGLKRIAGVLKWTVTSILTVLLLVFVGYLTVSGVIAGTADAVAVKAAKFTVSSMVPVVGGILSDAAEDVYKRQAETRPKRI